MALSILGLAIIVIVAIIGIIILLKIGKLLLKLLVHAIFGWVLLVIVNFIPTVHIPINILTVLVAGIGGVFGVILLFIAQAFGINLAI